MAGFTSSLTLRSLMVEIAPTALLSLGSPHAGMRFTASLLRVTPSSSTELIETRSLKRVGMSR